MVFVQPNPDGPEGEPMVALFELGARRAADAVRNGEQTAEALVEALLARCAASPLNAFISLEADRLRAAARAADQRRQRGERLGPLHGVPLALKDNIDTADFPTTGGTPARPRHGGAADAALRDR
jgi:mandelamide amidase